MSLPRKLMVNDDYSINEPPAGDYESLRRESVSGELVAEANVESVLENVSGDCFEMKVKIKSAE